MTNPETVSESFIKWMEDNGYGTFGTNIFLNQMPESAPDSSYWVVTAGGDVTAKLVTAQSIQQFNTQVFYRNAKGKDVERNMFALNQKINTRGCFTIDGFDIYSIEASMPEDDDEDAEDRPQASLIVSIEIYKSYVS